MPRTVLTLVRHGQTRPNAEGRWEGRAATSLTAEGRRQAQALGERLKPRGRYSAVYASALDRAQETAQLIAPALGGCPLHTEPALAEYDFGAWDGLLVAELRARGFWDAVKRDAEFSPPGGEPFGAAARRVGDALRRIASRHPGERAVVVGHGLSLAAALGATLDSDPRQAPRYALANAGMAELAFNGRVRLVHLDPVID